MIVITIISLYTVRVTLRTLGSDNYGIYNAVCSVIGFLSFISATLTNSAQRYLAFDLGKGDDEGYRHTFSMLLIVFLSIALIIVVVSEIIGPWIISKYLIIPQERITAAQWIFQLSIISLVVRLITIPYMASIVAYEKMSFYAYLSIVEVILKLLIVYALVVSPFDKLIFYGFLMMLMDVFVSFFYIIVCYKKLSNCKFSWYWNKSRFKEIGTYIGWNTFGSLSGILETQGMTIVTSMFFQPYVLAARAIADRVNGVAYSFVTNYVLASSPQLVKYYSMREHKEFNTLFYRTSLVSYYLMIFITVPLIILMPDLLSIWLTDSLLDDMIVFSRLSLLTALVSSLETPISRAVSATGQVKLYEITNCCVAAAGIPLTYLLFKCGLPAYYGYVVFIFILSFSIIYRILILKKYSSISVRDYCYECIIRVIGITIALAIISFFILKISISDIFIRIIVIGAISVCVTSVVLFISLRKNEKAYILQYIHKIIKRRR